MAIPILIKAVIPCVTITGSTVGILKAVSTSDFPKQDLLQKASFETSSQLPGFSEEAEDTTQPTFNKLSSYQSTEIDTQIQKKAERIAIATKAHKILDDYTFKLFFPCNAATGWILDYELPSGDKKYPTTWYFGTAAHVIEDWRFGDNPYRQILPISHKNTQSLRTINKYSRYDWSGINLLDKACDKQERYGYFDLAIGRQESDYKLRNGNGLVANKKIKEPKLFYLPMNFLESNSQLDVTPEHYREFAVIEVEFTNEKDAREITNNFADKYPLNSTEALNIFAPSLREKYTPEKLNKLDEDFFQMGYPKAGGYWGSVSSYDWEKGEGLRLSSDPKNKYNNPEGTKVNGHINANRLWGIKWDGKTRNEIGSYYMMQSDPSKTPTGGASGSMMTDKDGNILGVLVGVEKHSGHSFFTPLRQKEMNYGENGLKSPEYDFILGAKGQKGSYKEQVEKYGKNTWLRNRGWQHKSIQA